MTPGMTWLLIAWGIVTGILLLLLFYRSTLTRQEDDQLFIDETASSLATEQRQLIAKDLLELEQMPLLKIARGIDELLHPRIQGASSAVWVGSGQVYR